MLFNIKIKSKFKNYIIIKNMFIAFLIKFKFTLSLDL